MTRPNQANRATLAVVMLVLGACSSATEPAGVPALSVLFGAVELSRSESPSVNVAENDIVFRGAIETPCPSYRIVADVQRSTDGYVVSMRGNREGGSCQDVVAYVPYVGALRGVPSGNPRMIVRHVIEDAAWPSDTVINTRVVVP